MLMTVLPKTILVQQVRDYLGRVIVADFQPSVNVSPELNVYEAIRANPNIVL